ncbi:MAG: abortive infection family protein [Deltaproteobacteria bacterium]|nr:abortive infection family protein [Deltaproteobacteria bacterium]
MELLQNTLIATATKDEYDTGDYNELRSKLLSHTELKQITPEFIIAYRDLKQFWLFIKRKFNHYSERRDFIWGNFTPLLNYLEQTDESPADQLAGYSIKESGQAYITLEWEKCLQRRVTDLEGAITSARSLLETILKYILVELNESYKSSDDLATLFRKAAKKLNISPEQHTEEVFKQILGGMISVVNGFASLRNRYGDSHGKDKKYIKPSERHAKLAVNLAGTLAAFILETFEKRLQEEKNPSCKLHNKCIQADVS